MSPAHLPSSDDADDSRRYLVRRNIGQILVPGRLLHILGTEVEIVLTPYSSRIAADVARVRKVAAHYDHLRLFDHVAAERVVLAGRCRKPYRAIQGRIPLFP